MTKKCAEGKVYALADPEFMGVISVRIDQQEEGRKMIVGIFGQIIFRRSLLPEMVVEKSAICKELL